MTSNTPPQTSSASITTPQEKVDFLKAKVNDALQRARTNRQSNRRKASYIKVFITVLSGAATVLLGLQIPNLEPLFRDIAFIFTALLTVLNALEPFFNFRALWVEHEIALWKFYRLQDKIEYYLAGTTPDLINIDRINGFYNEYQNIWDDLSKSWIGYRKQEKS
jgi:hypothetical protein